MPTRQALDRIADKWTTLIVGLLGQRTHRFGELQRGIEGISHKVLSAVSAMLSHAADAAQSQGPLRNWAGNYRYGTNRMTSPTSVAQVQEFVRKHERFKVLGTRHCFNGIADSADAFLSLRDMAKVVDWTA